MFWGSLNATFESFRSFTRFRTESSGSRGICLDAYARGCEHRSDDGNYSFDGDYFAVTLLWRDKYALSFGGAGCKFATFMLY